MASDERAYVTVEWDNGREGVAISVAWLTDALAAQGLDVCTEAERRVLKAMGLVPLETLSDVAIHEHISTSLSALAPSCVAELARREAPK